MKGKFLRSKSAQRSTQVEQARQKGLIFKSVGLPCVEVAWNVLQLGAVCVGLWEGNCAKVLLALVCFNLAKE